MRRQSTSTFTLGTLQYMQPLANVCLNPLLVVPNISYQSAAYNTNARSQLEAAQDLWSFALVRAHT